MNKLTLDRLYHKILICGRQALRSNIVGQRKIYIIKVPKMIIIEPVLRILGFVCSYYMKCCRSPDCEAQSVNMSTVARLFGRTLPRVLNRTCSVKINSNINARNFFHSSRLFNKPFYTVTYDLESGEKHTVQVRELRRKNNKKCQETIMWFFSGQGGGQPPWHRHQQWHRHWRVRGVWGHPGLLHVSRHLLRGGLCQDWRRGDGRGAGHAGPRLRADWHQ